MRRVPLTGAGRLAWLGGLLMLAGCYGPPGGSQPAPVGMTAAGPDLSAVAASCTRVEPPKAPTVGTARQGRYNSQNLPNGWDALSDESAITRAIAERETGAEWPCFVKFYPGAATTYLVTKQPG